MSEHINVEQTISSLRQAIAGMAIPKSAPNHVVIQHRNAHLQLEMVRMMLNERNAGSVLGDILSALEALVANAVYNLVIDLPEDMKLIIADEFCSSIHGRILRQISGASGILKVGVEISSEEGGHA